MPSSQWHKLYTSHVSAPPGVLFGLLADLPHYGRWLRFGSSADCRRRAVSGPGAAAITTESRARQRLVGHGYRIPAPGSLDFHHTIAVTQLRATVDVHIHYSLEPENGSTRVCRWLVLDISMPSLFRPLRRLILSSFDKENLRTMAAVKKYAETHSGG